MTAVVHAAQTWLQAFLAEGWQAGLVDRGTQARVVEPPSYCVLSRSNTTVHLALTYSSQAGVLERAGVT